MQQILFIKGKTKFNITLDSGSWIFDDRKIDLDTYFSNQEQSEKEVVTHEEKESEFWHRAVREGAYNPPTLKSEKQFKKMKMLTGTFGIPLEPFINNAEPLKEATKLILERKEGNVELPLEKVSEIILQFSYKGKPLKEDGPVFVLFKDGSNLDQPIKNVTGFILE